MCVCIYSHKLEMTTYSQLLKIPVVLPLTDGVDDIVSNIKENLSL